MPIARVVRLKKRHIAAGFDDRVDLAGDGLHVALMSLVRAVYVEELESGPLRRTRPSKRHVFDHPPIHDMLAPAIGVERTQCSQCGGALVIAEAGATVAVCGGRRGEDKAR